ncbi:rhomboid family intramembrane serine protease [Nitratireductor sp. XY-223]|uniref:rhomboid family intramembrane serine protease n=1 Tax=Nitratireductor sp. XY-223 TaxID=2561926 RepID=UPI0010AA6F4F|nr:rhomboid family intramembrane serine protease [Nitratireductor sp. XY-223]
MFIPLHDRNDLDHIDRQYVTLAIIGINVLVWLATAMSGEGGALTEAAVLGLGFIPAVAYGSAELAPHLSIVPEPATYVTYAFLHANFMHLATNMLFLWVFGDNIEDALGHFRFLVFYLVCAAAGALLHGLLDPGSQAPLIGASGAVAGVVAAYLVLHPRVRVWVLALGRIPLPLPAWIPLTLWVVYQFVMIVIDEEGGVSWAAHIGGIIAGAVLVVVMKRREVPLFDRRIVSPRAVVHKGTSVPNVPRRWGR